jgi:polysaccharide export outer membrane protein
MLQPYCNDMTMPNTSRRVLLTGIGLALVLCVVGCTPGRDLSPVPPYDASVYRLGVGDIVHVVVFGETQLTADYRVNVSGAVAMPLIGSVRAAEQTSDELGERISDALKGKQILSNPSVSVEVTSFRSISVLGEVVKPGQYPYQPGMTMLTAVAAAGGFTYRGIQNYAFTTRQEGKIRVIGRLDPEGYVKPGDVLKIYERYF